MSMSRIERSHSWYLPLLWPVRQSGAAVEHNDAILTLALLSKQHVAHTPICHVSLSQIMFQKKIPLQDFLRRTLIWNLDLHIENHPNLLQKGIFTCHLQNTNGNSMKPGQSSKMPKFGKNMRKCMNGGIQHIWFAYYDVYHDSCVHSFMKNFIPLVSLIQRHQLLVIFTHRVSA